MRRSMAVLENSLSAVPGVTTMALLASSTYMASGFFLWLTLTGELKDCTVPGPLGEVSREAESKVKSAPGAPASRVASAPGVISALAGATDRLSPAEGDELDSSC